jgi:hypothetical protein
MIDYARIEWSRPSKLPKRLRRSFLLSLIPSAGAILPFAP